MQKRIKRHMDTMREPGKILKKVHTTVTKEKNYGLKKYTTIRAGWCPCSVCGHEYMLECEEAHCQCCSSACT